MIPWLVASAVALAPWNPIKMVCDADIHAARNRWLRALLLLGIAWFAWQGAAWLAILAFWCLVRWRSMELHGPLLGWVAVAATWGLLRTLPETAWIWLPWAWLAGAVYHVAWCLVLQRADWSAVKRRSWGRRTKGLLGSPVVSSFYFVLLAPFCPWWGWPLLAIGLYLTCSWTAFLALGVALIWVHPDSWLLGALGTAGGILAVVLTRLTGWRVLERTPRGDSPDGLWSRVAMMRCLLRGWWRDGHRWFGCGPGSLKTAGRLWGSRSVRELPIGEAHNEPLQVLYEYGLVGLVGVLAFAAPIVWHLRLGDPWAAAWVAGAVISLVHWPWRHPVLGLMLLTISARLI